MIKSIRHLRGTAAEWAAHDAVIPDGELAIMKTNAGNTALKIGNGIDRFSALPFVTGSSVSTADREITLMHGRSYRLGECKTLSIAFPAVVDDDYYSEISFDSGVDATEFLAKGKVRLTGDGVADEELMPRVKTHYTIFVWYDGEFQGIVRGLPNA